MASRTIVRDLHWIAFVTKVEPSGGRNCTLLSTKDKTSLTTNEYVRRGV
jgi:hypothetical protein